MRIGTFGLAFGSGNKGCEALSFSFLYILDKIAEERNTTFDILVCMNCDTDRIAAVMNCRNLKIDCIALGKVYEIKKKMDIVKTCDIIFDFTAGDSFSDIYGVKRFVQRTMNKQAVLWSKKPLVLGSQTYGPYKNPLCRNWAGYVIKHSTRVFARDEASKKLASEISHRNDIALTTDIAFHLPYEEQVYNDGKIHIGINPSGLLYSGGYTKNNQFGLKTDYKDYTIRLIEALSKDDRYIVHLIPHVLYKDDGVVDNDWFLCHELREKFPSCTVSEYFDTPMAAKSYISGMDVFIGARMHATIAAYSSGVPTIAFSYSRKFEGLFNSLDYPYVVSGREQTTDEAVQVTLHWINAREELKKRIASYLPVLDGKKTFMEQEIKKLL